MRHAQMSKCTCRGVEPAVQCNLVIAVGDLAFRYPNLLEPWTEHMYRPLTDVDISELSSPLSMTACQQFDSMEACHSCLRRQPPGCGPC